jgi:hypothetical protein
MICWLQKSDEERLRAFDLSKAAITFVHSEEECAALISPEAFVIISLQFAEDNIEKIKKFVRKYPNIIFYMFAIYDNYLTLDGYSVSYEPNVDKKSLLTEEIIEILHQFSMSTLKK